VPVRYRPPKQRPERTLEIDLALFHLVWFRGDYLVIGAATATKPEAEPQRGDPGISKKGKVELIQRILIPSAICSPSLCPEKKNGQKTDEGAANKLSREPE